MDRLFIYGTILAYVLSLTFYVRFLYTGKAVSGRLGSAFLACGLATHYVALLERSIGINKVPYHDLYGAMSLFGWLLALTYLGLELFHKQRSVGAFVVPIVLVFFMAAHLVHHDRFPGPKVQGVTFAFHVTLSILAYAAFALSCAMSLMFLAEE